MQEVTEKSTGIPAQPRQAHQKVFRDLCAFWRSKEYGEVTYSFENLAGKTPAWELIFNQGPCVTWILDIRNQQFVYLSQNSLDLVGYPPQPFLEQGLAFMNQIAHPGDLHKTWQFTKVIWEVMLALPLAERRHFRFSNDFRLRRPDGTQVAIMEQIAVLQVDNRGQVTHLMGVWADVTHLKRRKGQHPAGSGPSNRMDSRHLVKNVRNPEGVLTRRELEVLRLLAAGLNSRAIAEKLFISIHTVNTHRQKMIGKTQAKTTGGVIQFAISKGLI